LAGPEKSDGAFRTIREVADWLGVPTHVLRFWESKFSQIAPVKGAGGRRYYRPEDMRLLGGIKVMLHDQGLTIRGVSQKIDDDGIKVVMELSPELETVETTSPARPRRVIRSGEDAETGRVLAFDRTAPKPVPAPPDKGEPAGADQPGEQDIDADQMPDQPGEEVESVQPSDLPPDAPEKPSQPDVIEMPAAPEPDPDPPADPKEERGVERKPHATPSKVAPPATAPPPRGIAGSTVYVPVLSPSDHRKFRRIVRKLRGLIEEVEAELTDGDQS